MLGTELVRIARHYDDRGEGLIVDLLLADERRVCSSDGRPDAAFALRGWRIFSDR